jgi:hypothetical protein
MPPSLLCRLTEWAHFYPSAFLGLLVRSSQRGQPRAMYSIDPRDEYKLHLKSKYKVHLKRSAVSIKKKLLAGGAPSPWFCISVHSKGT